MLRLDHDRPGDYIKHVKCMINAGCCPAGSVGGGSGDGNDDAAGDARDAGVPMIVMGCW